MAPTSLGKRSRSTPDATPTSDCPAKRTRRAAQIDAEVEVRTEATVQNVVETEAAVETNVRKTRTRAAPKAETKAKAERKAKAVAKPKTTARSRAKKATEEEPVRLESEEPVTKTVEVAQDADQVDEADAKPQTKARAKARPRSRTTGKDKVVEAATIEAITTTETRTTAQAETYPETETHSGTSEAGPSIDTRTAAPGTTVGSTPTTDVQDSVVPEGVEKPRRTRRTKKAIDADTAVPEVPVKRTRTKKASSTTTTPTTTTTTTPIATSESTSDPALPLPSSPVKVTVSPVKRRVKAVAQLPSPPSTEDGHEEALPLQAPVLSRSSSSSSSSNSRDPQYAPRATVRVMGNLEFPDVSIPVPRTPRRSSVKVQPVTPQTPRLRDPSSLSQPTTPRHLVASVGKHFRRATPQSGSVTVPTVYAQARQVFARGSDPGQQLIGREEERGQMEAFLARCQATNEDDRHGCLYVSGPPGTGKSAMVQSMTGRYGQRKGVASVYVNCMSVKSSKDLYVSLYSALQNVSDAASIAEATATTALHRLFFPPSPTGGAALSTTTSCYLVVLDEIDHILTMGLESLYKLFEWSLRPHSRLLMVGIANALDLTDRFLPRLKADNLKPELLPFLPYTAPQIKNIILTRLQSLLPAEAETPPNFVPFIHPAAVELCARKVASQTGDLRRAFEICRRALDMVEMETRQEHESEARGELLQQSPTRKPLQESSQLYNSNPGSPLKGGGASGLLSSPQKGRSISQLLALSLGSLTVETAPRASISHLNKVTASAFSHGSSQRLKALNLQQKAALCALAALEKRNRHEKKRLATPGPASSTASAPGTPSRAGAYFGGSSPTKQSQPAVHISAPSIKVLFEAYNRLCTRDAVLHPLSSSEFKEVVDSLETLGVVQSVDGRAGDLAMMAAQPPQTPSRRGRAKWGAMPVSSEDRRVASCVGVEELDQVTDGVGAGILKSILSGEALD